MSYMLDAEAQFFDRSDPARIFIGRMILYARGYQIFEHKSVYRAWGCEIMLRRLAA